MKKAVIYTWVSMSEEDPCPHGEQTWFCRQEAIKENAKVVARYSDNVTDALLPNSPGLQLALADIVSGKANCLITPMMNQPELHESVLQEIENRIAQAKATLFYVTVQRTEGTKFTEDGYSPQDIAEHEMLTNYYYVALKLMQKHKSIIIEEMNKNSNRE